MGENSVCMSLCQTPVSLTNFHIFQYLVMSVNCEVHNAYSLYIIENTDTIIPRGNVTKEI